MQSPTTGPGSASMSLRHVSPGHCLAGVGLLAILTFAGGDWNRAQARGTPAHAAHPAHSANKDAKGAAREAHKGGKHGVHAPLHGSNYHPPYAAIVVDDNTDQTIYEVNADEPRHPASLTKIMTLYMLFEAARGRQAQARHAAAGLGPCGRHGSGQARPQGRPDHPGRGRPQGDGHQIGERCRGGSGRGDRRRRRSAKAPGS